MGAQDVNTWGISGSAFVAGYASTLVVLVALVLCRRRSDHPPLDQGVADGLDEYDVAMLNGGERLACVVALVNLDCRGALELGDHLLRELALSHNLKVDHLTRSDLTVIGVGTTVTLLQEAPIDAHPVEQAVYRALRETKSRTPEAVIDAARSSPALADLRGRLARLGLVWDADEATRYRRHWRLFVPLFAIGVVRLFESFPEDWDGRVVGLLAATAIAMWAVGRQRSPARRRRRRLIGELRKRRELASEASARGGDAMALALLGPGSLWWSDRPLALALGTDGPHEDLATTPTGSSARHRGRATRNGARGWVGGGAWGGAGCGGGGCGGGGSCGGGGCGGGG